MKRIECYQDAFSLYGLDCSMKIMIQINENPL